MLRKSVVRINFGRTKGILQKFGLNSDTEATVECVIKTKSKNLTRGEAQEQHDAAVDRVVEAVRNLPYVSAAPLRAVEIR